MSDLATISIFINYFLTRFTNNFANYADPPRVFESDDENRVTEHLNKAYFKAPRWERMCGFGAIGVFLLNP
jgi:hypothetical protein